MEENKNNIRSILTAVRANFDDNFIDQMDYFFDVKIKETDGGYIDLNTKTVDSELNKGNMSTAKFEGTQELWDALVKKNRITTIAMACHEANKVWCMSEGDYSQKHWIDAEQWQRESAYNGVKFRLENPNAGHDAQHNAWMQEKINDGWIYGDVKDAEKKTHPCIVPFDELPEFQKKKDALFCAIVDALNYPPTPY